MAAMGHEARAGRELVGDPGGPEDREGRVGSAGTRGDLGPRRGLGSGGVTGAAIWLGDPGSSRLIRRQAAGSARRPAFRIWLADLDAGWLGEPGAIQKRDL